MPEVPLRDQLAQCMTEEMAKKHRQKKQNAIKEISSRTTPYSIFFYYLCNFLNKLLFF